MKSKIADIIEDVILRQLALAETILISRNQLAQELECAPSQISYVLQSRFNAQKGFVCQSKRGSGGFVRICRLTGNCSDGSLYNEQEEIKAVITAMILTPENFSECQLKVLEAIDQLLEKEQCNRMQLNWVKEALVYILK